MAAEHSSTRAKTPRRIPDVLAIIGGCLRESGDVIIRSRCDMSGVMPRIGRVGHANVTATRSGSDSDSLRLSYRRLLDYQNFCLIIIYFVIYKMSLWVDKVSNIS
jgi:hypothetical protein